MDGREPIDPQSGHEIDGTADRESPYGLLKRAQELMRARHFAQAAILLERAARMEPSKGSILEALGRASYNAGDHGRAAEVFAELLVVDPSAHYAHYALGQSLKQLGRPDDARTHLRIAVALAPGSRLYGSALRRLGGADTPLVVGDGGATAAAGEPIEDGTGATVDADGQADSGGPVDPAQHDPSEPDSF